MTDPARKTKRPDGLNHPAVEKVLLGVAVGRIRELVRLGSVVGDVGILFEILYLGEADGSNSSRTGRIAGVYWRI